MGSINAEDDDNSQVAGPTRHDETESGTEYDIRNSSSFLIPVAILEVGTIPEEVKNGDITGYKQYMESTSNVLHDSSDKVCNARSRIPDICGERRGIALTSGKTEKGNGS
ncbi:hypothetical protein BKA70DRAFT_1223659 [Coprinopsis sp. MPI-PUGE-AT-0042]|nr:hypothetical protein BKA70DRAFT_1223659 [Coprinopsis sp. MPI-PUGE-AT-0042]